MSTAVCDWAAAASAGSTSSHSRYFDRHTCDELQGRIVTMTEHEWLAERFETHRARLRAVAYRLLGSLSDADDAGQETWLRLSRADTSGVSNLGGWLTTVVAHVCLDMLRSRSSRREEPLDARGPEPAERREMGNNPEQEAIMAESVGLALLVVLDRLGPAERLAFVLHDMFAVPFEEIATIVGRSPAAARQLASRARRRLHGPAAVPDADRARQHELVDAFLAASKGGNLDALLALLDPDVVLRADHVAVRAGAASETRGAAAVATFFMGRAQVARSVLVNRSVGVVVAPRGRLFLVLRLTFTDGKVAAIAAIGDPAHLQQLDLAVLND
jgi:RNA polymerase sigma factor (sigma-70 family)